MKRTLLALFAGALLLGGAQAALAAPHAAKLNLHKTTLGKIVVNGRGFTVYEFTRDTRNHDKCQSIRFCASTWPPVTTGGKPVAGPGIKASLLGRIKLKNGKMQVTYAGHPLYTYSGDFSKGQTDYVGFPMYGGTWNALNAAGKVVK